MADDPIGKTRQYGVAAVADSGVILASPCRLYHIFGINNNAAVRYIQLFNLIAVPADAVVPVITIRVAATSAFELNLGRLGWLFTTGLVWSNSSTLGTKTIGAADSWVNAIYR